MADFGKTLNPFEHCRKRPDVYIGSTSTVKKEMWVCEEGTMTFKEINYNQGLTRIFVEALSNAIDNKWRSEKHDVKMTEISVTLDKKHGVISITNNGYCIPVRKHEYVKEDYRKGKKVKESMYPAEVFFGEMIAGTNFEDDSKRKTSGRNGMGAKAIVVFSKKFTIDHTNPKDKLQFVQTYRDGGKKRTEPEINPFTEKKGYTCITFAPDYEYFGYDGGLDDDLYSLFSRFVYEAAMITGLRVHLNEEEIKINSLIKYAKMFYPENRSIAFTAPNGDACVILEASSEEITPQHMSWINGIHTMNGGIHVDGWVSAVFPKLTKIFNEKKDKELPKCSAKDFYPHLLLFIRAEAPGPKFDSQTKDKMVGLEDKDASYELFEASNKAEFMETITKGVTKMMKWPFIKKIEEMLLMKQDKSMSRKEGKGDFSGKITGDHLLEANYAGKKERSKCRLIITEGESARLFASRVVAAIPNGTYYYGTVSIRGKFVNTHKVSAVKADKNEEVIQIKKLLGLKRNEKYTDISQLRYGGIMIMADQDDDGYHIRGLLINFFMSWPSLFKLKQEDGSHFVQSFSTAVTIITKNKTIENVFYSNAEFKSWAEKNKIGKNSQVKYLKGLGSNEKRHATMYVKDKKIVSYFTDGKEEGKIEMAFHQTKEATKNRQEWVLNSLDKEETPLIVSGKMSVARFIDDQYIIYHKMNLSRALPDYRDGLKISQRKVLFGIFAHPRAKDHEVMLGTLVGFVKEKSHYHHGETSMENIIKNMSQGFVGSNNIPLLQNKGEFGSRNQGGEDSSALRYLYSQLEKITLSIFKKEDEPLLEKTMDDGKEVEYKVYEPVVPIILINGVIGIATGYSTNIPCYNPSDITKWIRLWLNGKKMSKPLVPWYRNFTGEIFLADEKKNKWDKTSENPPTKWCSTGILERSKDRKGWWTISELPIGVWSEKVKLKLDEFIGGTNEKKKDDKKKKAPKILSTYDWKGSPNTAVWDILPVKGYEPSVEKEFSFLESWNSLKNMNALDENGYPVKFGTPEELLERFCTHRLEVYEQRKKYWTTELKKEFQKENNRYKFVKGVVDKKIELHQDDESLRDDLFEFGLKEVDGNFDYLLSMQMRSMTKSKLAAIKEAIDQLKARLDYYKDNDAEQLWRDDLDEFEKEYAKFLVERDD